MPVLDRHDEVTGDGDVVTLTTAIESVLGRGRAQLQGLLLIREPTGSVLDLHNWCLTTISIAVLEFASA